MRLTSFTIIILILFSSFSYRNNSIHKIMPFTEEEILKQLDLAFNGIPNNYYPKGNKNDIKYAFFLDLEHGYFVTASSKIHLYADKTRWAIVFEKSGYQNRGGDSEIELDYVGNCINYPIDRYPERNYITNASNIVLISGEEYERIHNREGTDYEQFELISPSVNEINIRGNKIKIEHDLSKYTNFGIIPRADSNPRHLIGFEDIIRYINETNPSIISAKENEIKEHIPADLPKLMTIDKFHFESIYDKRNLPSTQELYRLIAKILVSKDASLWKPSLKPNNHWSNWKSGNL
jgi:hypothetical protein